MPNDRRARRGTESREGVASRAGTGQNWSKLGRAQGRAGRQASGSDIMSAMCMNAPYAFSAQVTCERSCLRTKQAGSDGGLVSPPAPSPGPKGSKGAYPLRVVKQLVVSQAERPWTVLGAINLLRRCVLVRASRRRRLPRAPRLGRRGGGAEHRVASAVGAIVARAAVGAVVGAMRARVVVQHARYVVLRRRRRQGQPRSTRTRSSSLEWSNQRNGSPAALNGQINATGLQQP